MKKKKKQVVIIESAPTDTLTKIAKALRKKGYETYGIEPFAKQFDNEKTFKCKIKGFQAATIKSLILHCGRYGMR